MSPDLLKAHKPFDAAVSLRTGKVLLGCAAVDAAYGKKPFHSDADRVAFLFERYLELTKAPLETMIKKPKRSRKLKLEQRID